MPAPEPPRTPRSAPPPTPMVSVFGSAGPRPGDADYALGLAVGAGLARLGCTVRTGGYMGMMEAASRGAVEAGGHTVGVTCRAIEAFRPARANAWVREELATDTLHERLRVLTTGCAAAVVLPGGVGTLTELALVWNTTMVGEHAPLPIVAIGEGWARLVAAACDPLYVAAEHARMVTVARDAEEALAAVARTLGR